ncbi:unnamed protein product [Spirodela intermedia]|uniref:Uncharacterized protein n=1 Tax=Spirodela intermedia TaxID=51605 RepID=A0A7I8KLM6_SPIIN|nr:unnamed protein product [Spirodela intermedia]
MTDATYCTQLYASEEKSGSSGFCNMGRSMAFILKDPLLVLLNLVNISPMSWLGWEELPEAMENGSRLLRSWAIFLFLNRRQAACMKQAAQVLQEWECSARRAKPSTSTRAFTVLVEDGRLPVDLGSRAHVSSSSPQKSPGLRLSNLPRMMKSISVTGSPSRTM